jgi:prepilin-type N-terminal cleavage/methylation domain-containing protein
MTLKSKQKGFTIVELLIVIVVIGILAALVVTTFTGIQKKGRDTERQTDIKAIHGQVEAYYAQNGKYPTLANLNDTSSGGFLQTSMKGLDTDALYDPKQAASDTTPVAATEVDDTYEYSYIPTPSGCDNTTTGGDCTGYTLNAELEDGGDFEKTALN